MNSSMPVKVYNYPDDSNTDVIIVGKTSASNIPLPDVISTTIQVLVASVANRAVNPTSEIFNTTECNTEELNPTATTTTTTTTPVTTSPVTTTTVTSAVPTFTGMYMGTFVYTYAYIDTYPYVNAISDVYVCTYMHVYIHIYVRTCIYTVYTT